MRILQLTLSLGLLLFYSALSAEPLTLATMPVSEQQNRALLNEIMRFRELNPQHQVSVRHYGHEEYKRLLPSMLAGQHGDADVFFWFAGTPMDVLASKQLLAPLDKLWPSAEWPHKFSPGVLSSVSSDGHIYGLPFSHYGWGFYYQKSLFKRLDLQPPQTWPAFLAVAEKLIDAGVTPFALGSKHPWTLAGWFDYLNMRVNGPAFHQQLLQGKVSFTDPRVTKTFLHWRQLLDKGYFPERHASYSWDEVLPLFFRQRTGMLLMGSFFVNQIPDQLQPDIGFFPFPTITPDLSVGENAPTDILLVKRGGMVNPAVSAFLRHMGDPVVQSRVNAAIMTLPPHRMASMPDNPVLQSSAQALQEADQLFQFFDREASPELTKQALDSFAEFMRNPQGLANLLAKLERQRLSELQENNK
ncbi:extracellular solute-binding protein [Corallincola luteus]|uniref:Extracellular solute-binding protein n=1 Tax=Corallincola luteus TaxID=1775177 RepID=A0ABY2AFH6_9GAMM|nr:extracellular solute-binding protein [Corallincola luteus]TCI01168.1 extracellular solute-binding protein [Corallincola luteus]